MRRHLVVHVGYVIVRESFQTQTSGALFLFFNTRAPEFSTPSRGPLLPRIWVPELENGPQGAEY